MAFIDSDGVQLYVEETGAGHPIIWAHEFAVESHDIQANSPSNR